MKSLFSVERRVGSFENPSTPLTSTALLNMFGGTPTAANISVSEETAMNFAAVFRSVSLLSGVVAALPLGVHRYSDKSEVVIPALTTPNSNGSTPFEIWETVMTHLLLWGNAYVHKVRNPLGKIVELRPIHPNRVRPEILMPTGAGDPTPPTKGFFIRPASGTGGEVLYTTHEIMHIPGLSYDGVQGLSPISCMRQTVAIGQAADRLAAKLFGNGALLSGVLSTDRVLDQEQADIVKSRWREKMAGIEHGHDIAVLDAGTKFTPISMPPEDAQFLQTRRWQVIEIARWFGIPPHLVGDVESSTSWGTGIEQQNIAMITYTVKAWLTRIEQRITWEIVEPSTQYAEFNLAGLLRGDTKSRYEAYASGIQWGWLTRNEARRLENLEPIDGLDVPVQPLNMPSKSAGKETAIPDAGVSVDQPDLAPEDPATSAD